MKTMFVRIVVLVAAVAAMVAPIAGPAAAEPVIKPLPGNCWNEFDTVKQGQTITISAIKDCVNLNVPQSLSLSLQLDVCDEFGCAWVTWKSGTGVVTYTCPGTFFGAFRNSRLPSRIVYCD